MDPKALKDYENSLKIRANQNKLVFRDFSIPVKHGRARVIVKSSTSGKPLKDIITNQVVPRTSRDP